MDRSNLGEICSHIELLFAPDAEIVAFGTSEYIAGIYILVPKIVTCSCIGTVLGLASRSVSLENDAGMPILQRTCGGPPMVPLPPSLVLGALASSPLWLLGLCAAICLLILAPGAWLPSFPVFLLCLEAIFQAQIGKQSWPHSDGFASWHLARHSPLASG